MAKMKTRKVQIKPPNWKGVRFRLEGTAPYVQHPFGRDTCYLAAEGWNGIPTFGIRQSLLWAARSFQLKSGGRPSSRYLKFGIFVENDGFDAQDASPLCRITKGRPRPYAEVPGAHVFASGWKAEVVIRFDADWWKPQEVIGLLRLAGSEVGIGRSRQESAPHGTFAVSVV